MSNIIGRPSDGLLDVMLGPGSDPEQAVIGGSEQEPEERDGAGHLPPNDEPAVPDA